jgi:hypothetical protein
MTAIEVGKVSVSDLITASRKELDDIFLKAATPTMGEMVGMVDGRVGSVLLVPDFAFLKKFINLGWFPWRGKIFEKVTETESKGINRFRVGPFKFLRFHCETFISNPLVGPNDVYCLNYDLAGNPGIIRRIRDDIKKVDEGLFLGTANMRWRGKHRFTAYFILRSVGR